MLKTLVLFLFMLNLSFSQTTSDIAITNGLINKSSINKNNLFTLSFNIYYLASSSIITKEKKLMAEVIEYIGTPYKYGGMSKSGIDCSAFTQSVYWLSYEITLPRTAASQFEEGEIIDKDSLEFGDLVFFHTSRRKSVGHVGIYIGGNNFVHSGRSYGVSVASLLDDYYSQHFIGAKRIFKKE